MSSIVQYNDWLEEEVLYSKELLVIYTLEEKVLFVKRGCLCFSLLESPWYANLSLDKPQVYHTYSWPKTQQLVTFLKRVDWNALSVFSLSFTNVIHGGLGCLNACALNSGWKRLGLRPGVSCCVFFLAKTIYLLKFPSPLRSVSGSRRVVGEIWKNAGGWVTFDGHTSHPRAVAVFLVTLCRGHWDELRLLCYSVPPVDRFTSVSNFLFWFFSVR